MTRVLIAAVMLLSLSATTVVGAASDPAAAKQANDPAAVKAAEELFEVIDMRANYSKTIDMMLEQQIAGNPQLNIFRDTMKLFFSKYMGWEAMKGELTNIYCKHFTAAEIKEITAFNKTPTGQKAARLMPQLTTQSMAIAQRRVNDNMAELQAMMEADIKKMQQEAPQQPQP